MASTAIAICAVAGDQDDRQLGVGLVQFVQPLGAAHARQANVAHHDGRHARLDLPRARVRRWKMHRPPGRPGASAWVVPMRTSSSSSTNSTRMAGTSLTVDHFADGGAKSPRIASSQVDRRNRHRRPRGWRRARCRPWPRTIARRSPTQAQPRARRLAGDERLEQVRQDVRADAGPGVARPRRARARPAPLRRRASRAHAAAPCIASIALRIRLTSTLPSAASSAITPSARGCTSTSTAMPRSQHASATMTWASAMPCATATGASGNSPLCAKVLSCEVRRASRSTMPRDTLQVAARPPRAALSSAGSRHSPTSARMAVSGWLSSCTIPADIWPSAAILPACTSSSCAARNCAVRATTVDSRVSCAACSAAWLASLCRTRAAGAATARQGPAAAPPSRRLRSDGRIAGHDAHRRHVVEHHQAPRRTTQRAPPRRVAPRRRARSTAHRVPESSFTAHRSGEGCASP